MNGACAVIARSNVWTKDSKELVADPDTGELTPGGKVLKSQPKWDYRIKVDPWQVFGNVELEIIGEDIEVEHVWAANVVEMTPLPDGRGVRVKTELDNTPQDDQQFDIDGTGVPSVPPTIVGCSNLEPVETDCKLIAKYSMLNSFEGTVSSKVHLETWQEGAYMTLDFSEEDEPPAISEVWGATLREPDEDDPPGTVKFRLMAFNHHTPTDRRSCFGFDATPPFHHLPRITCIPSRPFPPPPPPSPPSPPPAPPPYIQTERSDCFLGGRVTFVTTPGETPGTLWEVNVKMERWLVGAQLTLNFYGEQLYQHKLRVASLTPPDAVSQVAITAHSLVLELRATPVHEFNIMAYGRAEGLGRLSCCCAEMPSPPPPPPRPPPDPAPPPGTPRSPPLATRDSADTEWGRGIIGTMDAPPPSPPPLLEHSEATTSAGTTSVTAMSVLGLMMFAYVGMRIVKLARSARALPGLPLAAAAQAKRRTGKGLRVGPDDGSDPLMGDEEASATTKLHIEVSHGERCALRISLDAVDCMEDLQDLIAEVCEEAGFLELDDLVMAYKRPDTGEYVTVTRSVTIEMLKESPALRLAPAEVQRKADAASGKASSSSSGKKKKSKK